MIALSIYLMIAAYLLGKLEDGPHSPQSVVICLAWLPAALIYLSALLAENTLGDHPDR
ncbi:MFS transporter permease [Pantoea brenneri]|uniref:MFS transporter permease n=1 Tax=Pantoea brenneri TaxID=472694 RepID=A0AAX3J3N6_9GAMM|nr:MFS transporter permease [Pantoea brenneri]VXB50784.1 MFS transporter permease [Pantoea brenneri]